jgi:hypothetical protein
MWGISKEKFHEKYIHSLEETRNITSCENLIFFWKSSRELTTTCSEVILAAFGQRGRGELCNICCNTGYISLEHLKFIITAVYCVSTLTDR